MEKQQLRELLLESINEYQEGLFGGIKTAGKQFGSKMSEAFKELKSNYQRGSKEEDIKKMMEIAEKYGFKCVPENEYKNLVKAASSNNKKKK